MLPITHTQAQAVRVSLNGRMIYQRPTTLSHVDVARAGRRGRGHTSSIVSFSSTVCTTRSISSSYTVEVNVGWINIRSEVTQKFPMHLKLMMNVTHG